MNRIILLLICLTVAVAQVSSQVLFKGTCPKQSVVKNFNVKQYLGKWYENRNYFAIFQLFGQCVTAEYSDAGNGLITVKNTQRDPIFGKQTRISGQAKLANPSSTRGSLSVSFSPFSQNPYADRGNEVTDPNYLVLDTDYKSYSIVWNCNNYRFFNTQILWVLTRERSPPRSLIAEVLQKIRYRGLDTSKLEVTRQKDCPYH